MLNVQEVRFDEIPKQQWAELVKQSHCASFFQSYDWVKLWLAHFSPLIEKTLILAIYNANALIGIAPFTIKQHCIEWMTLTSVMFEHTLSDYGDIIALPHQEEQIWSAVMAYLTPLAKTHSYTIKLDFLRENSVSYTFLSGMHPATVKSLDVAPKITLPSDWLTYESMLTSHSRHELKRKMRSREREGLRLSHAPINATTLNIYRQLITRADQQKQQFYSPPILNFFLELLHQQGVELYFLHHPSAVIAALIVFNDKHDMLAYNSIYDLNFIHCSPGIVLFQLAIQHAMNLHKQSFDFLRGNERYKYSLGAVDQKLYQVTI